MKYFKALMVGLVALAVLTGCDDDAAVVNHNLNKAADNFELKRRIIFYNGITGEYMLNIEGLCSIGPGKTPNTLLVTCKTGKNEFKRHQLGLSDNVTFFLEQVEGVGASAYHYRVTFKPQQILPDFDFRGSTTDAVNTYSGKNYQ